VALCPKKVCKLWIWKALCRKTGRLIDWECGGRAQATLKRMWHRLRRWEPDVICADRSEVYPAVIPSAFLLQSKAETVAIERNNGRQRHWFARFRRKTIAVSRSVEMIDLTLGLFAAYHVNKTWNPTVHF
jgi:insertion element IS1 protein InsB